MQSHDYLVFDAHHHLNIEDPSRSDAHHHLNIEDPSRSQEELEKEMALWGTAAKMFGLG